MAPAQFHHIALLVAFKVAFHLDILALAKPLDEGSGVEEAFFLLLVYFPCSEASVDLLYRDDSVVS